GRSGSTPATPTAATVYRWPRSPPRRSSRRWWRPASAEARPEPASTHLQATSRHLPTRDRARDVALWALGRAGRPCYTSRHAVGGTVSIGGSVQASPILSPARRARRESDRGKDLPLLGRHRGAG